MRGEKKVFLKIATNRPTDQTRPDQTKLNQSNQPTSQPTNQPTNQPTKPNKSFKKKKKGINHIEPTNEEELYQHTKNKLSPTEQSASLDLYETCSYYFHVYKTRHLPLF
jgi:hypothetical protein